MSVLIRAEVGPVPDQHAITLLCSDLNTTQIVTLVIFDSGRVHLEFWAEGFEEARAALIRATHNIAADFTLK